MHRIIALVFVSLASGCVMDRDLALDQADQPLDGTSELEAACEAVVEAKIDCGSAPSEGDALNSVYCRGVLGQSSQGLHACYEARPSEACLGSVSPLIRCVAERRTCNPEEDCSEFWIPECAPDYVPPAPPLEFFTTCRGLMGIFLNGALFQGNFEECADGHEYAFECPVNSSCGMECTCLVDGQVVATVTPDILVSDPHSVLHVQEACGWTVPAPANHDPGSTEDPGEVVAQPSAE